MSAPAQDAVNAAVEFVALQLAGPERILARHYPTVHGTCAGCVATPVRCPCSAARIANLALNHPAYQAGVLPAARFGAAARPDRHRPPTWSVAKPTPGAA